MAAKTSKRTDFVEKRPLPIDLETFLSVMKYLEEERNTGTITEFTLMSEDGTRYVTSLTPPNYAISTFLYTEYGIPTRSEKKP